MKFKITFEIEEDLGIISAKDYLDLIDEVEIIGKRFKETLGAKVEANLNFSGTKMEGLTLFRGYKDVE